MIAVFEGYGEIELPRNKIILAFGILVNSYIPDFELFLSKFSSMSYSNSKELSGDISNSLSPFSDPDTSANREYASEIINSSLSPEVTSARGLTPEVETN